MTVDGSAGLFLSNDNETEGERDSRLYFTVFYLTEWKDTYMYVDCWAEMKCQSLWADKTQCVCRFHTLYETFEYDLSLINTQK